MFRIEGGAVVLQREQRVRAVQVGPGQVRRVAVARLALVATDHHVGGLGLGPRALEDGTRNTFVIHRLKDKFGTRAMPSAEVGLRDAFAWQVGALDRGLLQAPFTGLGGGFAVSHRATLALRRAGITVKRPGSHTFRHSCVQRLVEAAGFGDA